VERIFNLQHQNLVDGGGTFPIDWITDREFAGEQTEFVNLVVPISPGRDLSSMITSREEGGGSTVCNFMETDCS